MLDKKRVFDCFCVVFASVIVVPLGILSYPILIVLIGKPIVFKQLRIGKNGKVFVMYKLRSMYKNAQETKNKYLMHNEAPAPMFKIANDPRFLKKKIKLPILNKTIVLRIGRYLSQSGIDEIPQLLNVFKGEMSIFGPRPLPITEAEQLEKVDKKWHQWRHSVKPGIFSAWALDAKHNQSFNYWKKLEKETLQMTIEKQIITIWKIIIKQLKRALF